MENYDEVGDFEDKLFQMDESYDDAETQETAPVKSGMSMGLGFDSKIGLICFTFCLFGVIFSCIGHSDPSAYFHGKIFT